MIAKEMEAALKNLKEADHAVTVQKDWLRRAEKRQRECQAAVAALVKGVPPVEEEISTEPLGGGHQ